MNTDKVKITRWARWLATFIGFPIAALAARAVAGNIDSVAAAAFGGLSAGVVLGAVQVFVGGVPSGQQSRWICATGAGLALGLATGAGTVGYRTDTASLVVIGAASGAAVGLAQALTIRMSRRDQVVWTLATPLLWAGGWLITSQVIVDADRQHALFGGPGALTVAALAGVLYAMRRPASRPAAQTVATSTGTVVA